MYDSGYTKIPKRRKTKIFPVERLDACLSIFTLKTTKQNFMYHKTLLMRTQINVSFFVKIIIFIDENRVVDSVNRLMSVVITVHRL